MDIFGENSIYALLPLIILVAALLFGVVSRVQVGRAKRRNDHSAMRENHFMPPDAQPVEGRTVERR